MTTEKLTEIQEFNDAFLREANEHLESMNDALLKMEKKPGDMNLVYRIFHAAHSFKSMAALMEYRKTETLCHAMEDVLSAVKKKEIKLEQCIDILFESVDKLESTVKNIAKGKKELDASALVNKLRRLAKQDERIADSVERIEDQDVDDMPDSELTTQNSELVHTPISTIEVKVERLDRLMNLAEELLVNKMWMDRIKGDLESPELTSAVNNLDRLVTEIQFDVMQSRLVPIGFVFRRFPRMVRDMAKQQGKRIELQMEGSDIELDRAIIDEIGEAMGHLLRNCIDHGIEKPDERKRAGKPPEAIIKLTALRDRGLAVIEIQDDGRGLDVEEIKRTAIKTGLLTQGASREDVIDTVFHGLSTTKQVTKTSGRGFGLNIVKKKVESLGGVIKIETAEKEGTVFRIEVPLTLAVIKSLFVGVGGKSYAIPVANVVRLVTVKKDEIKGMLENEGIILDGEDIPITRLNVLFKTKDNDGRTADSAEQHKRVADSVERIEKDDDLSAIRHTLNASENLPMVIVKKGGEMMGLLVDELLSTQEIVIKPLHRLMTEEGYSNKYFAGSAIIGTGEAILVLDVGNLVLSCRGA
ncbi:MAG: chemotaxis protein CheA [Pseudomonadota bacterium]